MTSRDTTAADTAFDDTSSPDTSSPDTEPQPVPTAARTGSRRRRRPPSDEWIRLAVDAALDRKAEDLKVLALAEVSDFTDHFMICSGTNERQVQAIADGIVSSLRDVGVRPLHTEGERGGRWILLDYGGDMVIHVFLEDTRRFYDLERLWSDAPDVTARFADSAAAAGQA